MTIAYKVLGQIISVANTATTVYTVPSVTQTVVSTITVCNQASTPGSFSIAIRPGGTSLAPKHYVNYNTVVPGNDTVSLTLGITLGNTDVITANANTSTISFNVFGSEIY